MAEELLTTSDGDTYPGYMVRILEMLAAIRANQDNMMTCIDGMSGRVARIEGRTQDLALNLGTLCLQTEHLTKSVEAHEKRFQGLASGDQVKTQQAQIQALTNAVEGAKGSWKAVMVIASITGFLASLLAYLVSFSVEVARITRGK